MATITTNQTSYSNPDATLSVTATATRTSASQISITANWTIKTAGSSQTSGSDYRYLVLCSAGGSSPKALKYSSAMGNRGSWSSNKTYTGSYTFTGVSLGASSTSISIGFAVSKSNGSISSSGTLVWNGKKSTNTGSPSVQMGTISGISKWLYTLKVNYNANGGTQGANAKYTLPYTSGGTKYGSNYNFINFSTFDLTRSGYSRTDGKEWVLGSSTVGWDQDIDYTSQSIATAAGVDLATADRTIKVYANWTPNKYTATFDKQGGTGGTSSLSVTFNTIPGNITPPTRTGYTFQGYALDSTSGNIWWNSAGTSQNRTWTIAGNATFYAVWKANTCTVTYYGNGATGVGANENCTTYNPTSNLKTTVTYGSHTAVNLYNVASLFVKTGYFRQGSATAWRVGSATSTTYMSEDSANFASYLTNTTNSLNLYANWVANTYTVSYNGNGHTSGSTANSTHTYGVAKALTINGYVKTGHTFLGWSTSSTATTATYTNGQSVVNLTATSGANIVLYAVWRANTYTITYNANGGSGAPSATSYTYATSGTVNLSTTIPTRTGYTFLGWSLGSSAEEPSYTAGQAWNRSNANNYILYAVWKANTYTVTFNPNGGSPSSTKTVTYDSTYGTLPTVTRTGYSFAGWFTATSGGTQILSTTKVSITSNQTLYARWTMDKPVLDSSYPINVTVEEGKSFSTRVSISNQSSSIQYTYEWYVDDVKISTTSATPNITAPSEGSHTFYCIVSNSAGSTTSREATLTVVPVMTSPMINTNLNPNYSVNEGENLSVSIVASSNYPFTLTWEINKGSGWVTKSSSSMGAIENTNIGLQIYSSQSPATVADNGMKVRATLSNDYGTVTSIEATITVILLVKGEVQVGGNWYNRKKRFVQVNGQWKEVTHRWVQVNGQWKQIY